MKLAIELEDVVVAYGEKAVVEGLSLSVKPGEKLALVGPSGAGKSTLLGLCTGGLRPRSGRVSVLGHELRALPPDELRSLRRRISLIPQELGLIDESRCLENLLAVNPRRSRWWQVLRDQLAPPRQEVERAHATLGRFGIGDKVYQPVESLSGGERQRVAVARALYRCPELVLADEPVASVDPALATGVLSELLGSDGSAERTWVVSLHQPQWARDFFDRVVGIRDGAILFDRAPSALASEDWRLLYGDDLRSEGGWVS